MDPHQRYRDHVTSRTDAHLPQGAADTSAGGETADQNPPRIDAPDGGAPPATDRRPQYLGSFTMIPPNESRRSEMRRVAQREEEELQRWRETHRVSSVHENPERLGGNVSLAEARQRQQTDLRCSKLQKKLKKEEQERRRRQEEGEQQRRMKAEQRQKAERLEERRQQEEQRRRGELQQDHLRTQESFLQRFERTAPRPPASSGATHTSSMSEAVETKVERSSRERELDRKRVNSDFLDRLEGRGGARQTPEAERPRQASEDFTQRPSTSSTAGQRVPLAHLKPEPEQSWTQEADPEPDFDWSLMKLMNSFPDCNKAFLEDILHQCNGDYQEAYTLLICTLS